MIENEASYLIAQMPDLEGVPSKDIEQHYLSDSLTPLRLRHAGGTYELTKKLPIGDGDLSRFEEITVPLDRAEYAMLVRHAVRSLQKTRYRIRLDGGLTAELDVYRGPLEGLASVEVEFPDDAARAAFVPPEWFGRDVSQEEWSMNQNLAGRSYDEIAGYVNAAP